MIVCIVNEKGGVSKSSLAVNFCVYRALAGHNVLLIDTDPQQSSMSWSGERDASSATPKISTIFKSGRGLQAEIVDLANRFDDIIIDTGGRDSPETRTALVSSNLCIVPVQPSQADLWSLQKVSGLIDQARSFNPDLIVMAVLTRCSTNPAVSETEAARDFIASIPGFHVAKTVIRDRMAWKRSFSDGLSVLEMKPADESAKNELSTLSMEIFK